MPPGSAKPLKRWAVRSATELIVALTQRFESEIDLEHARRGAGDAGRAASKSFENGDAGRSGGVRDRRGYCPAKSSSKPTPAPQDLALAARQQRGNSFCDCRAVQLMPPKVTSPIATPPMTVVAEGRASSRDAWGTPRGSVVSMPTRILRTDSRCRQPGRCGLRPSRRRPASSPLHRGHFDNWSSMTATRGISCLIFAFSALRWQGSIDQTAKIWDADYRRRIARLAAIRLRSASPRRPMARHRQRTAPVECRTGSEKGVFANTPTRSKAWLRPMANDATAACRSRSGKPPRHRRQRTHRFRPVRRVLAGWRAIRYQRGAHLSAGSRHEPALPILERARQPVGLLAFNRTSKLPISAGKPAGFWEEGEFKG